MNNPEYNLKYNFLDNMFTLIEKNKKKIYCNTRC